MSTFADANPKQSGYGRLPSTTGLQRLDLAADHMDQARAEALAAKLEVDKAVPRVVSAGSISGLVEDSMVGLSMDDSMHSTYQVSLDGSGRNEFAEDSEQPKQAGKPIADWESAARIYEYGSAANPELPRIPVVVHPASLHENGPTRVIPFDLSNVLGWDRACTSPNLLASYVRILVGEHVSTSAQATSQAYYVIRGSGATTSEHGRVTWSTGDLFVVPKTDGPLEHACVDAESHGGAALYWIHDQPLLDYLGVAPSLARFKAALFSRKRLLETVEEIRHGPGHEHVNRLGVLLGNEATENTTKTLTHTMWSLLNSIGPRTVQRPHRHNSVALDLAVSAPWPPGKVYTLMGRELDANGDIIDPIRCDWADGSVFVTPPGWWHSHHNESDATAWVLPIQDAGLYTHQRTLDIRFADDEVELHRQGRIRGTAFRITNKQYTEIVRLHKENLEKAETECPNFNYGLDR